MSAPRAVHQLTATAEPGAVGAHTAILQQVLRQRLGVASEVFAEHIRPGMEHVARPLADLGRAVPLGADDVVVYQLAIGSVVADRAADGPHRLVVNYHNLTPVEHLRSWDPGAAHGVEWGRRQLVELAGRADLGLAVSEFNRADLVAAGYRATATAPVLFRLDPAGEADPVLAARLAERRARGPHWLFVGRLASHKCQHHVIRALAATRQAHGVDATLSLVGGPLDGSYAEALRAYVDELGLGGSVELAGPVSPAALAAHYQQADVFVCLSEHEGFGVPALEAMWHGVPVVTLASSALPETVGDAALVLPVEPPGRQPAALAVAAAAHRACTDAALRAVLVRRGLERVDALSPARAADATVAALAPVLG